MTNLNLYYRIKRIEAAMVTFTEEGIDSVEEARRQIEVLRDKQRGPRKA